MSEALDSRNKTLQNTAIKLDRRENVVSKRRTKRQHRARRGDREDLARSSVPEEARSNRKGEVCETGSHPGSGCRAMGKVSFKKAAVRKPKQGGRAFSREILTLEQPHSREQRTGTLSELTAKAGDGEPTESKSK